MTHGPRNHVASLPPPLTGTQEGDQLWFRLEPAGPQVTFSLLVRRGDQVALADLDPQHRCWMLGAFWRPSPGMLNGYTLYGAVRPSRRGGLYLAPSGAPLVPLQLVEHQHQQPAHQAPAPPPQQARQRPQEQPAPAPPAAPSSWALRISRCTTPQDAADLLEDLRTRDIHADEVARVKVQLGQHLVHRVLPQHQDALELQQLLELTPALGPAAKDLRGAVLQAIARQQTTLTLDEPAQGLHGGGR